MSSARSLSDLPKETRDYLEMIERETGVKVKWVSVGPRREQTFKTQE